MAGRQNPNFHVTTEFRLIDGKEGKKLPRVHVWVEGKEFVFARNPDTFELVIVFEETIEPGTFRNRVKQEAHVVAGAEFNRRIGNPKELRAGVPQQQRLGLRRAPNSLK
jgi:hypothetical protein